MNAVELFSNCTIRGNRANGPSIGVVPTRASLEGQTGSRVRALALDTQVEERELSALQPDQVTLALSALRQLEQEEQARSASSGSSG